MAFSYQTLTREQFEHLLDYNPDTGLLTWKTRPVEMFSAPRADAKAASWNGRFAGTPITCKDAAGYLVVQINRKPFRAHRIAVALQEGECPGDRQVDHINGVRDDNRWVNLRLVEPLTNQWNKKRTEAIRQGAGPIAGVKQNAKGRWECRIRFNYQHIYLGTFDSEAEAIAARQGAERAIRSAFELGEGPTHGKAPTEEHPLL